MKSALLVSLIAVSGACVDQVEDNSDDTTTDVPRLAVNGKTPSMIIATTLDTAALTGAAIAPYTDTADRRSYLEYIAACALDSTQSVSANGYTFVGAYGLATGWTSGALSASDRRWVSACVLARVNFFGVTLPISMRGSHAALALDAGESGYTVQEGAYYGDIFGGSDIRRACIGADKLATPTVGNLTYRVCTVNAGNGVTSCSFAYDGECASTCTVGSNGYNACTDTSSNTWSEVIKVQIAPPSSK